MITKKKKNIDHFNGIITSLIVYFQHDIQEHFDFKAKICINALVTTRSLTIILTDNYSQFCTYIYIFFFNYYFT